MGMALQIGAALRTDVKASIGQDRNDLPRWQGDEIRLDAGEQDPLALLMEYGRSRAALQLRLVHFRLGSQHGMIYPYSLGTQDLAMVTNSQIYVTAATVQDEPVLWRMLTFAASMGSGGEKQIAHARSDPYLSSYVSEWGTKRGDLGVIARDGLGEVLGAAWLRLGDAVGPYKLADQQVPELATAVIPQARRRGVGSILIKHLLASARLDYPRIVLSVREENPAVLFYCKLGFREVARMQNRVGGGSLVMALDFGLAGQHPDPMSWIQNA
jgi:GNAT superfamily N-acetyltransferase